MMSIGELLMKKTFLSSWNLYSSLLIYGLLQTQVTLIYYKNLLFDNQVAPIWPEGALYVHQLPCPSALPLPLDG